jgi:plastocyanin
MKPMRRSRVLLLSTALLIGGIGAAACSDSGTKDVKADTSTEKTTETTAKSSAPLSGDQKITISNYKFDPATITVKVGTKITWTNKDSFDHTATADDGAPAAFDTDKLKKGASADVTFDKAGTYKYSCAIHSYMKGTVEVVG